MEPDLFGMPLEAKKMSDDNELGIVIDDTPALATPEPEELAPEIPAEPQDKTTPENPLAAQSKIAEHEFKRRKAERENAELRKKLAEKEAAQTVKPEIPAAPDPRTVTEEQYRLQTQQREEAIRQAAVHDAQQQSLRDQLAQQEAAQQRTQIEELNKTVQTYSSRAVQLGVKPEELQQAGEVVGQFGLDPQIAEMILQDEQGPLITKYLATNLSELERLNNLSPLRAAIELTNLIKPKAAALKPRVSNAPPPVETVGSGSVSFSNAGPAGATYE